MDHHATYMDHAMSNYGDIYTKAVGRYQEGFIRDKVCKDVDAAFCKAVEVCEKLIHVFKIKSGD